MLARTADGELTYAGEAFGSTDEMRPMVTLPGQTIWMPSQK